MSVCCIVLLVNRALCHKRREAWDLARQDSEAALSSTSEFGLNGPQLMRVCLLSPLLQGTCLSLQPMLACVARLVMLCSKPVADSDHKQVSTQLCPRKLTETPGKHIIHASRSIAYSMQIGNIVAISSLTL